MLRSALIATARLMPVWSKLVPVMPDGALFPDFDCVHVGVIDGIDWSDWLSIFEKAPKSWAAEGSRYFDAFMDADAESYQRWNEACPLGVLNAELALYSFAVTNGEMEVAASYRDVAGSKIRDLPLRIMIGSRWPLLLLLSSENLRKHAPPQGSPDIANDVTANCLHVENPVLNWPRFQSLFWGAEEKVKEWMVESIRYVYSWQMVQIPKDVMAECPLGYITAVLIKAFTCATSESSCFESFASQVQNFFVTQANLFEALAHSWWPLSMLMNHMARAARHKYYLDFTEDELAGSILAPQQGPQVLADTGRWLAMQVGASQSFRDLLAALPHLGAAPKEAPTLVYITMIYGKSFNRHLRRFCSRAQALGTPGARLLLFTLDQEAFDLCWAENGRRCIRGTPSILNKFTLPLLCARLGLDSVWIDLDVFLMADPTPAIVAHAEQGPYEILISGSFEADCICNGIVYFRSTATVSNWLLAVIVWMYHHPYEHDQKTFSAFLNYTEQVTQDPLDLPPIPSWDTLDPINQFVTPDIFEGNGWMGDLDKILIYHFLNGDSDTGSGLDPSGTWRREHGRFGNANGSTASCGTGAGTAACTKVTLMDLFYGQEEELYTTAMPAYQNQAIRAALLSARKEFRSTKLLGMPCGPMVGWQNEGQRFTKEEVQERLEASRRKWKAQQMAEGAAAS
ncbi:unnamed protein product [Durusdinium trenchii]|uniref:Nucleotide-diphospho-sugar transferase domain-containing protein n=1 Tax=Durusdinium trenchii TaxID=1381693 RepID=A0ABP0IFB3_9DINO